MSAAHLRLVECRAILGGERDPFRATWDEKASRSDRRLLLAMARATVAEAGRWSGLAWCDLRPEVRAGVVAGLRRFRGWAEGLGDE